MVAAVRADVQVVLELVVPIVGAALRARVRVPLALRLRRRVSVLDGNVDPGRHTREFRRAASRRSYSPSARASRVSGSTFRSSGAWAVKPAPTTAVRDAISW